MTEYTEDKGLGSQHSAREELKAVMGEGVKRNFWFVWIAGTTGPNPQIWNEDQLTTPDGKEKPTLFKVKLAGDDPFTFTELCAKYPPPIQPNAIPPLVLVPPIAVTLISYTGHGNADPMYAARLLVYTKNTRLEQGQATREMVKKVDEKDLLKELDYISKTIRSSWEFVDYTFEIKNVTRAFTHQLVRTRTASYAQQAQRVVDMSSFNATIPDTVKANERAANVWSYVNQMIGKGYKQMQELGIPNQDCRGLLPTNVHTNIIAKINLRTLADLLAKRKNLRAQGEYAQVARLMEACVLDVHPWTKNFIDPDRLQTPEIDALLKAALGSGSPIDQPKINAALKELDALKGTWG